MVADDANEAFVETVATQSEIAAIRRRFASSPSTGKLLDVTDQAVDDSAYRLETLCSELGDDLPNLLVRNLLRGVGIAASMRRRGDNAVRMDLLLGSPSCRGVAEVEFGSLAILDAPRDVLDDLAVLVGRHGWSKKDTATVVITDNLPNRRSEYWRIIKDIRSVLGLRLATVTILALELIVWSRGQLSIDAFSDFHVDDDTRSYRTAVLERVSREELKLSSKPRAYVDIAK